MSFANELVTVIGGAIAAISGVIAALVGVLSYRRDRRNAAVGPFSDISSLINETADVLAGAVNNQWQIAENQRRINDPFPLPVRWLNGPDQLFDHWSNIMLQQSPISSRQPDLSGGLESVNEQLDRIPSRRLVVLGRAGAGKTILATRFVLDSLERRSRADPVPVIFGLASWDPESASISEWLISSLIADYPGLGAAAKQGSTLAAGLVNTGRILPVLDGFDEMAESLRPKAITALNLSSFPFVLTSRPAEYEAAVDAADVLTAAAGVIICDLTTADLAEYLPRTTRKSKSANQLAATKWDSVIEHMRRDPDDPHTRIIRTVLSTPLMVGLARAIYSDIRDADPTELLDNGRFASIELLENHLLDAFVPAAYQKPDPQPQSRRGQRYSAEDAQRWLSDLAVHLNRLESRDLAWWQLGDTIPLGWRLAVGGIAGLVAGALFLGVIWRFGIGLGLGFGIGIALNKKGRRPILASLRLRGREGQVAGGAVGGITGGFVGGLSGGFILHLFDRGTGLVIGLLIHQATGPGFATTAAVGIAAGLIMSTGAWSGRQPESATKKFIISTAPEWLEKTLGAFYVCLAGGLIGGVALGLAGGVTLGISCGMIVGVTTGLETYIDLRFIPSPFTLLSIDRRNALRTSALYGLVGLLAITVASWGAIGPLKALALGVGGGLTYAFGVCLAFYAWGNWIVFTRGWLPLTGRMPFWITGFIGDAYRRGVLRQAGAVYQFRHYRLQDRLFEKYSSDRDSASTATSSRS
ncbi:MAG: NACHT domain-containing protein [Streptosporangiaceae bacterium]